MIALLIGIVVALGAVALVLDPVLRPGRVRAAAPAADEDDPLGHRKDLALAALKEIEFDRATGKLDDADYERMKATYTAEALAAIREVEDAAAPVPQEPALAQRQVPAGVGGERRRRLRRSRRGPHRREAAGRPQRAEVLLRVRRGTGGGGEVLRGVRRKSMRRDG